MKLSYNTNQIIIESNPKATDINKVEKLAELLKAEGYDCGSEDDDREFGGTFALIMCTTCTTIAEMIADVQYCKKYISND